MKKRHSVARRIGLYFITMMAFAALISGLSLGIMASNQSDAALINVSGSLRMQSYRLIYEMEHQPTQVNNRLLEYQQTLNSPELQYLLSDWFVTENVTNHYQHLKQSWQKMEDFVIHNDRQSYLQNIENYAHQVNNFVLSLQQFVELKLKIATWIITLSMLLIILLAYFGIWYIRKHVIMPLNQLLTASLQVQNENFHHIPLPTQDSNELGLLSKVFTQMASQLAKLYISLENEVENKTRRLLSVNRSLVLLHHCSQILTTKPINKAVLIEVLQNIFNNEQLQAIALQIYGADYWNVTIDNAPEQPWQSYEIAIENEKIALLRWKPSLLCPDERLIQNVSQMIGRSIYVMRIQKQQQQLILMEERAIIARELHDSLAQSLTFFKIQISLLKRINETTQDQQKQYAILQDLEQALNDAYSQLRELLATFRLTIQEANLTQALEQVLNSLKTQTQAHIRLNCKLPSHIFSAQQQVHVLQIVREAVINAIKHANATEIEVIAETNSEGEHCLIIRDNGSGLRHTASREGHYGLTIMRERTLQLEGEFSIKNRGEGGVEVTILLPNMMSKK